MISHSANARHKIDLVLKVEDNTLMRKLVWNACSFASLAVMRLLWIGLVPNGGEIGFSGVRCLV